jgi:putative ABC transport system permease protein
MYVIKNALRCIGRSKGRNVLIGIIALVIAVSACIGLSIRQAAVSAKEAALGGMSITATISYDRATAMGNMSGGRPGMGSGGFPGGGFDKNSFADKMGGSSSLTLEEYQKYAAAESVQNFYYTLTAYWNGSESFSPVSDEAEDSESQSESDGKLNGTLDGGDSGMSGFPGGMGGMMGGFSSGNFTVIGYSSDGAMTAFVSGSASVVEGVMFDEGTSDLVCVISEELAMYNSLSVGDSITITNPAQESETYTLTVSGSYAPP